MRILGIDPGLGVTGYGLIENQEKQISLLEAGTIKTSARQGLQNRLNEIYREINRLINNYKPEVLVLENLYSHYKHPTTAILMGHVRGVICLASGEAGIPLVSYAATRIKKAVTGSGRASKEQVQGVVGSLLRLDADKVRKTRIDVTDALALTIGHVYIAKTNEETKA